MNLLEVKGHTTHHVDERHHHIMGRHTRRLQRVRRGEIKPAPGEKQDHQDPQTSVDIHEEKFYQDEIEQFHEAKEKLLLEGGEGSSEDDGLSVEEEEVMGWSEGGEESGEDDSEFQLPPSLQRQFYASDEENEIEEEEQQQHELSDKAWGRSKKTFYAVEGEDDLSGSEGSEAAAELEEKEVIALQQRMAAALRDTDFQAPSLAMMEKSDVEAAAALKEERVVQDLSRLSKEDKLALLEKDSPELFDLLEDFDSRFSEAIYTLRPLVTVARETSSITPEGREYLEAKLHLNLIYCMNIMFYLHLKASRVPVQSHPVIQRIVQIRQLIGRLEPLDEQLEGQLEALLEVPASDEDELESSRETEERGDGGSGPESGLVDEKVKEKASRKKKRTAHHREESDDLEIPSKKPRMKKSVMDKEASQTSREHTEKEEDPLAYYERVMREKRGRKRRKRDGGEVKGGEGEGGEMEPEDGKRAITFQIARNKGLIPQRKKEQRNPRVKHRNKYRKALVKRKSQVRAVVTEVERYGGESSGIRANVSHSVKIK